MEAEGSSDLDGDTIRKYEDPLPKMHTFAVYRGPGAALFYHALVRMGALAPTCCLEPAVERMR